MERRPPGRVRVRWGGQSDAVEAECADVADVLSEAAARWFASNQSPDAFVMAVVIERDGKTMTDDDVEAYLLDRLALKRAASGATASASDRPGWRLMVPGTGKVRSTPEKRGRDDRRP